MKKITFDPASFTNYFFNVDCWFKTPVPSVGDFTACSFDEMWKKATEKFDWLKSCYVDSDGAIREIDTDQPVTHFDFDTTGYIAGLVVVQVGNGDWEIVKFKDTESGETLLVENYPKFLPDGFIRYRQNIDKKTIDSVKANVKVKYCTSKGEKIVDREPDGHAKLTIRKSGKTWTVTPRAEIADYLYNNYGITLDQYFEIVEVQDLPATSDVDDTTTEPVNHSEDTQASVDTEPASHVDDTTEVNATAPVDTEPAITPPATPADYQIIITARKSSGGIYSKDVGYDSNGHILFEVHQGRGRYSTGYLSYNQKGALVFSRAKCANIIVDMKKRVDEYKKSGAAPARIIAVDESFYFFTICNYSVPGYELDARIDLKWWTENLAFIDFFSGSPENRQAVYQKTDNQQVDHNKRVYLDFADHDLQESKDCVKLRALEGNKPAIDDTPAVDTTAPTENPVPVEDTPAPATENTPVDDTAPTEIIAEDAPKVITDNGDEFSVRYKIAEIDAVIPSHIFDGSSNQISTNANYPAELQPRDRGNRLIMATAVREMANHLRPADLLDSRNLNQGAPVVYNNNIVLNGNGRVMAIRLAYDRNTAAEYRSAVIHNAAKFGITGADKFARPILIREIIDTLDAAQIKNITQSTAGGVVFSASEQAAIDAGNITLASFKNNNPNTADQIAENLSLDNGYMIERILYDIASKHELNGCLDKNGNISAGGKKRVEHALFALAYGNDDLLARITESTEDNTRLLTQAMLDAAPAIARYQLEVKAGMAYDYNFPKHIADAAQKLAALRDKGKKVADFLKETCLWAEYEAAPEMTTILAFFDKHGRPQKNISPRKDIASYLLKIVESAEAQGSPNQITLFSGAEYGNAPLSAILAVAKATVEGGNMFDLFAKTQAAPTADAPVTIISAQESPADKVIDISDELAIVEDVMAETHKLATPAENSEEVIPMTINAGTSILAIQNSAAAAANANATAQESTTIDTKETIEMTANTNTAAGDTFTLGTTESEIDDLVTEGNALAKIVNDAEMHSLYLDEKISTALSDGEDPEIYIAESKALQPTIAQESRITEINHRLHELGATGGFYSNEDSHIVFMSHVDAAGDKSCELLDINKYAGFYAAQSTANTATATTSAEFDATVEATEDTIAVATTTTTIADANDIMTRALIADHKREKDTAAPVENPAPEIDATPAPANDDTPATDATAPILFMSDCHPTDAELGITCKKIKGKTVYYKANGEKVSGDKLADHRRALTNEYVAKNTIEGQMQGLLLQMNWHLNDLHDNWVKYATAASKNMAREFHKKLLGSLKAPSDNTQERINMAIANLNPDSYDADPSDIARKHEEYSAALAESQAALKALVDKYPPVAAKFALRVHNALHATAPALPVIEYPAEMTPAASDAADDTAPAPVEDPPAEQETPAPVIVDTPVDAPVDPLAEIDLDDYAPSAGAIDAFVDAEIALVTEIFAGRIKSTLIAAACGDLGVFVGTGDAIASNYADMCKARADLDACDEAAIGILKAAAADLNVTDALADTARTVRNRLGWIDKARHTVNFLNDMATTRINRLGDIANHVDDLLAAYPAAANDTLVAALVNDFNALFDAECGRIGAALELVNSIRTPLETAPDAPPATPKNPAPVVDPAPANPVEYTPVDTPDAPVEDTPAEPVVDTPVEDTPAPVDTEPAVVDSPVTANDIQSLITAFNTAVESINADAVKSAFDNIFALLAPKRADAPIIDEVLTEIENTYAEFKASLAAPATPVDKAEKPAAQPKSSKPISTPAAKIPATPKKKDKPEPTALDKCKAAFREASKLQSTEFVAQADIALADWRKAIADAGESDTAIAEYNAAVDAFNARKFCRKNGHSRNHYTAA